MQNYEISIKDNGGYLDLAPATRVNWKVRYADLKRQSDGLMRYADQCRRAQIEAEMRLAEHERRTAAELARAESGACCWRRRFQRADFERRRLRVLMFATGALCVLAGVATILAGGAR